MAITKAQRAESKRLTRFVIAGFADFQACTPWAHAPMSEQDVEAASGAESEEQKSYWDGFFGASQDAARQIRRQQ